MAEISVKGFQMKYEYSAGSLQGVVRKALGKDAGFPEVETKFSGASGSIDAPLGYFGSEARIGFDNLLPQNVTVFHSCDGESSSGYFVEVSASGRNEKDGAECPGNGSFSVYLPRGRGYVTIRAPISTHNAPLAKAGTVIYSVG